MGHEHWVPSCHCCLCCLCSERFTPSCFQGRWGVGHLRPDVLLSIFQNQIRTRSTEMPVALPLPPGQEVSSTPLELSSMASGPVHFMVLGSSSETMLLTPCPSRMLPQGQDL
ncbi:THAP domain-containing protein 8 [Microtus ochrogaster]|uniref:THAP domain-containing protein 8 n=1 Tax=Microtus ochrogaster TaxID=79684 RepID=A0ABM1UJE6_MICOH|nr:THAP domain-containing protein 8 [Microtus ochrogaster]